MENLFETPDGDIEPSATKGRTQQPSGSVAAADGEEPTHKQPVRQQAVGGGSHKTLFLQDSLYDPLKVTHGALLSGTEAGPAGGDLLIIYSLLRRSCSLSLHSLTRHLGQEQEVQ